MGAPNAVPSRVSGQIILCFLLVINLVNYMDRGIVAGAPIQFSAFIQRTLDLPESQQQTWLGVIFSAFIGVLSVSSLIFGHMLHKTPPFKLLSAGLSVWVLAMAGSGAAYFLGDSPATFWFFLLSRATSGIGEAAFQTIVPPYIEDMAPPGSKGVWLAMYYIAIPTGTALGMGYGAIVAPDPPAGLGWGAGYLLEAGLMAPCALLCAHLPSAAAIVARRSAAASRRGSRSDAPLLGKARGSSSASPPPGESTDTSAIRAEVPGGERADAGAGGGTGGAVGVDGAADSAGDGDGAGDGPPPSLLQACCRLLRTPPYVLLVLGYAAYTATLMGIAAFGSLVLLALGLYKTQTEASVRLSLAVGLGGTIGTPLGGWIADQYAGRARARAERRAEPSETN